MSDIAIKIEGVSKRYTVGRQKDSSLRGSFGGLLKSAASKGEDFWALNDISFEVNKGEVIGVIGKNGAGKSTLLKVLSQITKPTKGRIEINGFEALYNIEYRLMEDYMIVTSVEIE